MRTLLSIKFIFSLLLAASASPAKPLGKVRAATPKAQASKSIIRQDVSFGIADIKYDGTSLKILELGEGTRSMFAGFDSLYGEGAMWSKIWQFLSSNKPFFFVDDEMTTPAHRRAIAYSTLVNHGGIACTSLDELAWHQKFARSADETTPPLIVIRHDPANAANIQKFHTTFPHVTICNAAIAPFVNNKKLTDQLFTDRLRAFRPWTITIKKNGALARIDEILAACPAKQFVIKPLSSSKGEGILFVPRRQLAATLQKIIVPNQRRPITRSINESYWMNDTETELLIESCENSKPICAGGKLFNATLRVVYGLISGSRPLEDVLRDAAYAAPQDERPEQTTADTAHPEEINIPFTLSEVEGSKEMSVTATILGCYWKLPTKPLDATGTLEEKKLSHIEAGVQCAAPVSADDAANIAAILQPVLTSVYETMLQKGQEK